MSLLAMQRTFLDFLLDQPTDIPVAVNGGAGPGLAVYHNAYSAQLIACLKDSYERLWAITESASPIRSTPSIPKIRKSRRLRHWIGRYDARSTVPMRRHLIPRA